METNKIYQGHVLDVLPTFPDKSVNCIVTSPPYWGLRDYGIEPCIWDGMIDCNHEWQKFVKPAGNGMVYSEMRDRRDGGSLNHMSATRKPNKSLFCTKCNAWRGSYGLEPTPELYVKHTVQIFREVWRVLKDDGTIWLNLGDTFWGGKGKSGAAWDKNNHTHINGIAQSFTDYGQTRPQDGKHDVLKPKDLCGIPWRVAFALQDAGWYLRIDIIWNKKNSIPEAATDRPTRSHEYVFLLSKSRKYYYDADAIKERASEYTHLRVSKAKLREIAAARLNGANTTAAGSERKSDKVAELDGFIRANESYDNALCLPVEYRNKRSVWSMEDHHQLIVWLWKNHPEIARQFFDGNKSSVWTTSMEGYKQAHFATFPTKLITPCILAGCPEGGIVLDPFIGSGTTGEVALRTGRKFLGIELNPDYIKMADKRLEPYLHTLLSECA